MEVNAIEIYKEVLRGSLKRFPAFFWQDDKELNFARSAAVTRYLIEEILKWNDEQVKADMCSEVFSKYKLKGMLTMLFNDSFFAAIDNAYPGKYNEWDFSRTPRNYWDEETARKATIWLFKERLKLDDEEILKNMKRKTFVDNGLDTMMHVVFGNNATRAVKNAFGYLF